ncbi:MAG: DUF4339 domain-containing protein, partial [Spirochaetales bacterium]|nr:DUF4339 domain-containing protein [Spirochaetales bacterium]
MGMAMAGQMGGQNQNQYQTQPQGSMAPPPPPTPAAFFVFINGQQTGPMGMQQLQQMVAQGQVTGQSQVWKQGMPAWAALSAVPELAGLLSAGGPPPPPSA